MLASSEHFSLAAGLRSGRHVWLGGAATLRVHCGTAEVHGYLVAEGQQIQIVAPPYDAPIPVRARSPRDCRMYATDAACHAVIEAMRAQASSSDTIGRRSRATTLDGADFLRVVVSISRLPGMEPCLSDYDMAGLATANGGPLALSVPGVCVLLRQSASSRVPHGGCFLSLFEDREISSIRTLPLSMQPSFAGAFGRSVDSNSASSSGTGSAATASLCKVSASSFVLSRAWKRALNSIARQYASWIPTSAETANRKATCPVIMVFGAKGAGKSTFVRLLVNRLLSAAEQQRKDTDSAKPLLRSAAGSGSGTSSLFRPAPSVAYLDLDVGQPEHGPPGMLTLAMVHRPLLTPPHLRAPHFSPSYGIGSASDTTAAGAAGATVGAATLSFGGPSGGSGSGAPVLPSAPCVPHAVQPCASVLSARFYGDVTPASDPALFTSAVRELLAEYRSHPACCGGAAGAGSSSASSAGAPPVPSVAGGGDGDGRGRGGHGSPVVPLVINCHGWMKGIGYETLQAAAEAACPSHVVYLDSRDETQRNRHRKHAAAGASASAGAAASGSTAPQERVPEPGDYFLAAYADPALADAKDESSAGAGGRGATFSGSSSVGGASSAMRLRRHQHLHHMPAVVVAPAAAVAASRRHDDVDPGDTEGVHALSSSSSAESDGAGAAAGALSALLRPLVGAGGSDGAGGPAELSGIEALHPPTHPRLGPPALAALAPRKAALAARLIGGVSAAAVSAARQRERFVIPDSALTAAAASTSASASPAAAVSMSAPPCPVQLHMLRAWHMSDNDTPGSDSEGSGSDGELDDDDDDDDGDGVSEGSERFGSAVQAKGATTVDADADADADDDRTGAGGVDVDAASVASSSSSTASHASSLASTDRMDAEAVGGDADAVVGTDAVADAEAEEEGDQKAEVADDDAEAAEGPDEAAADNDDDAGADEADDVDAAPAAIRDAGKGAKGKARLRPVVADDGDDDDDSTSAAAGAGGASAAPADGGDAARNRPPPRAARSPADARAARLMSYFTWGAVSALASLDDESLCDAFEACCGMGSSAPALAAGEADSSAGSDSTGSRGGVGAVSASGAAAVAVPRARSFIVGEFAVELSARRAALLALARETLACVMADARMARAPSAGAASPAALFASCPAMTVPIGPGSGVALLSSPSDKLPLPWVLGGVDDLASAGPLPASVVAQARGFEGQLVGLCSTGLWLREASGTSRPPAMLSGGKIPCIGVGYVRAFDLSARTLQIVTPIPAARLHGELLDIALPSPWSSLAGAVGIDGPSTHVEVHTGVDVLVCWRGSHDMPLALLHRSSPHGDSFTVAAADLTSVRETAAAGASRPGRKNLKRRRIGE